MFVTLFLAILDIKTGMLSYSSAGHNPPAILKGDEVKMLEICNEPVAGAMPGMTYTTKKVRLEKGDTVFLYTDGVTEAMNSNGELFSEKRLMDTLDMNRGRSPQETITAVSEAITSFTGDAPQSDDITMLALKYTGV
jgi:sigma-B regulation protein RsbU (phosphoserine phosphatase)